MRAGSGEIRNVPQRFQRSAFTGKQARNFRRRSLLRLTVFPERVKKNSEDAKGKKVRKNDAKNIFFDVVFGEIRL
jgi:hypothetical protein